MTEGCIYGAPRYQSEASVQKQGQSWVSQSYAGQELQSQLNVKYDNVKYQTVCVNLIWYFEFEK